MTKLRCDPFLAILIRLAWTWGFGVASWHLGTQWAPWQPQPDLWQVVGALFLFGWGLWHLAAWALSDVTLDRAEDRLTLGRLTWQGLEVQVFTLSRLKAVVLVPQSGPGRYALPPPRIELRLEDNRLVPVGTIATIFAVESHAQRLATAIGCGVEDLRDEGKPDPNGTV